MNQHSGPATLPRGFRCPDYEPPRTPEPSLQHGDDVQIPSPPRPRLKLRRRVVSQLTAPTQQFLASVAAADVPIPSIEEPEIAADDCDMGARYPFPEFRCEDEGDINFLRPGRRGLPAPKTPVPELEASLPESRYPNWAISSISSVESTPEPDYDSRPSTARSTLTSASLFSRFSHPSDDDDQCDNFGVDLNDQDKYLATPVDLATTPHHQADLRGKARKAPWTKAMSDHLWSTFTLYLQDPKVTPFRMGKSCVPPHGVCLRVAREAKRSWKGAKALSKAAVSSSSGRKSGSATPTAESSGTFIQWPHTCAATRAHLRELCRLKASSRAGNLKFASRSTTPFTQAAARHWNRRSTPARPAGASFATQDMSVSLAMSTAESMQPGGPLAQLTASAPEPTDLEPMPLLVDPAPEVPEPEPSFAERSRLGSPFGASSSYGPSSSGSLAAALGLSGSIPRRQSQTVGNRRGLQSPVRLSRAGTQKRRHTQSGVPRKRPSIGTDLWLDPSFRAAMGISGPPPTREVAASSRTDDDVFMPRVPPIPTLTCSTSMPNVGSQLDDSALLPPPRLGSPFTGEGSSFSFPHRVHRMHQGGSIDLGVLGRPFATIQQFSSDASSPPPSRNSLADRLAYIDQRLKELRQRDANHRAGTPM